MNLLDLWRRRKKYQLVLTVEHDSASGDLTFRIRIKPRFSYDFSGGGIYIWEGDPFFQQLVQIVGATEIDFAKRHAKQVGRAFNYYPINQEQRDQLLSIRI